MAGVVVSVLRVRGDGGRDWVVRRSPAAHRDRPRQIPDLRLPLSGPVDRDPAGPNGGAVPAPFRSPRRIAAPFSGHRISGARSRRPARLLIVCRAGVVGTEYRQAAPVPDRIPTGEPGYPGPPAAAPARTGGKWVVEGDGHAHTSEEHCPDSCSALVGHRGPRRLSARVLSGICRHLRADIDHSHHGAGRAIELPGREPKDRMRGAAALTVKQPLLGAGT